MSATFVKVGRIGKTHGLKGELKITIDDPYFDDVMGVDSLLVAVGGQYVPYFVQYLRSDSLLKLEDVESREAGALLQHKDVYLPADRVSAAPLEEEDVPFEEWLGFTIADVEWGDVGTIDAIMDLPQHYLAEVSHQGKPVYIPMHPNLILEVQLDTRRVVMQLPEGLLEL